MARSRHDPCQARRGGTGRQAARPAWARPGRGGTERRRLDPIRPNSAVGSELLNWIMTS